MKRDKNSLPTNLRLTGQTLIDIIVEGVELKQLNGRPNFSKIGKNIVGKISDFDMGIDCPISVQDCLVIFNAEPNTDSRFIVKKVNAYSLKVEVYDPD